MKIDSAAAHLATIRGEIRHRDAIPLSAPSVEIWSSSGGSKLHDAPSRLSGDKRSASFISRPLPMGFYRVRVAEPRSGRMEKPVELAAHGPASAMEFILEDSPEHKRNMAVLHYRAGLAHLFAKRFKEAAAEFDLSSGWDGYFEPLADAREKLALAIDRSRRLKAIALEKKGRLAGAYFQWGRLGNQTPESRKKRDELRRRIAKRSGIVVAVGEFSDTPAALGHGEKLRRLLGSRLARAGPGLTTASGPSAAKTMNARGVGFDSSLKPAEAARLLAAVGSDVIVIARVLAHEALREGGAPLRDRPRGAQRRQRVPNPEYLRWKDQASRIKRTVPARVVDEQADLVTQLAAEADEKEERVRFALAAGAPPPEFIEKEESAEPAPPQAPRVLSVKMLANYRLITAEGISKTEEGALSAEGRGESGSPSGAELAEQCGEKFVDQISARLWGLVRAKSESYLRKASQWQAAGNREEAIEEAANALMAAPSGLDGAKAGGFLRETLGPER